MAPVPATDQITIAAAEPLLDAPEQGERALRDLDDQLATAAARNDLRPAELRTLLRADENAWVDTDGLVHFIDPGVQSPPSDTDAPELTASAAAPLAETFTLHSNPDADLKILLDFDGSQVADTAWNTSTGYDVTPGDHPAWDPARDGATFSAGELRTIQQVWAMVAEDYAPFNVDVTTHDPGEEAMVRTSESDASYGVRVLITPSADAHAKICAQECGGVAYLNVFDRIGSFAQPAWVFPQALGNSAKNVAEASSHEAGHTLGLQHDGDASYDYYQGHGVWAPIMGVGYSSPVVQWSAGSYTGANNQQDDLKVLNGIPCAPSRTKHQMLSPPRRPFFDGEGVIGTRDDVDTVLLGVCEAGSRVEVRPAAVAPNLDLRVTLHDSDGTQRAVAEPSSGDGDGTTATGLGGDVTIPAAGGGWCLLAIEGAGQGDWATGGYDDYGSLGAYTVDAPGCDGALADGVPSRPGDVSSSTPATQPSSAWRGPRLPQQETDRSRDMSCPGRVRRPPSPFLPTPGTTLSPGWRQRRRTGSQCVPSTPRVQARQSP